MPKLLLKMVAIKNMKGTIIHIFEIFSLQTHHNMSWHVPYTYITVFCNLLTTRDKAAAIKMEIQLPFRRTNKT